MYSVDTYTEKEFKIMQFLFPAYRRFYIKGKDEEGNFDIWTFYKDGDAAPYGRLNYIYSEKA